MRCVVAIALCVLASVARAAFPLPSDGQTVNGTVYYDESADTYRVEPGLIDSTGAAWGTFANTLNQTGWGVLNIATSNGYDDSVQMYAAGLLEGALTAGRIAEQIVNMEAATFDGDYSDLDAANAWLDQQDAYTAAKVQENPLDPFWNMIGAIRAQLLGLFDGYTVAQQSNSAVLPAFTFSNFSMLNAFGDLLDILPAIDPDRRLNWANLTAEQAEAALFKRSACSAMIKVTYDLAEMFTSHSTWFSFSIMNRVYKNYNLQLNSPTVVSKQFSMSSYPGVLASVDDFWQLDSNLVVMETTNSIINMTLYDQVTPASLLSWQRVRAANALSADGASWCANLARENSGTYNNQYMVVNYNLFSPGQPLSDGTLWVCEQMIGLVESHDVTPVLARGYWPSYNVPAFEAVYNLSGYPQLVEQYGVQYSYQLAPRAQIFRRDQTRVVDMPSMQAFMRYNNFTSDPVSQGNPTRAICARADLRKKNPSADGCLDTKVTSVELQSSLSVLAQSGPTTYFEPAFDWDPDFSATAHFGQPDHWDFPFVTMQPAFPQ